VPGSRYYSSPWFDLDGNLCLFGGYGYNSTTEGPFFSFSFFSLRIKTGYLNDLWTFKFIPDSTDSTGITTSIGTITTEITSSETGSTEDSSFSSKEATTEDNGSDSLPIIAGVAGGLVALIAVVAVVVFLLSKRKKSPQNQPIKEKEEADYLPFQGESQRVPLQPITTETAYGPITVQPVLSSTSTTPTRKAELNRKFEIDYNELTIGDTLGSGVNHFSFSERCSFVHLT